MHADSGDLARNFILRPNTGKTRNALSDYAQIAAGANERFFQLADKIHGADARLKGTEIENRIANKLSGAVEGYVTTTIGLMQFNSIGSQELARCDDVLRSGIAPHRDHRRVFQQKQRMANASFFYQLDKGLLQLQRNGVIHAAEIKDIDDAKGHAFIVSSAALIVVPTAITTVDQQGLP